MGARRHLRPRQRSDSPGTGSAASTSEGGERPGRIPEIAALDGGLFPGWQRTGETLPVYAQRADGTVPVCRFYGLPAKGLDSHFYSASAAECAAVQQKFGDSWVLESSDVFEVYPADVASGTCPFETTPAYRVYNSRADANHRYTTSLSIRDSMLQAGWIPEGYGPNAVASCVPR
jgi:hypothetical protein